MLAIDLVDYDIPALKTSDTIAKALQLMDENRLSQLAVIHNDKYVGMLEEDALLDYDESELIETVLPDFSGVFVLVFQHLYELLGTASRYDLKILPVLDEEQKFVGSISSNNIYQLLAKQIGTYEPGAIIEMSLLNRDYSLSEISRLIESENAKVTSSYITGSTQDFSNPLRVTLKLNKVDISAIVATLERFGYTINAAYAHAPIANGDKDRYDMLMKYLSI
jgi:predicted transcriptional regulator